MEQDLYAEEFDLEQMEAETEAMLALNYLDRNNSTFRRTPGGFVSLDTEDKHYARVQVFRTFPFTGKNLYISIREADEKAREIGIIHDLDPVSYTHLAIHCTACSICHRRSPLCTPVCFHSL